MKRLLLIVLGWLMLSFVTHAASFDCGKATTKVEKLICADAELSKLDEELSAAYKTAIQDEKQAEAIRQAQKQWMKERNVCADVACVMLAYEMRLKYLSSFIAAHPPSDNGEATEQKTALKTGKPRYGYCVDVGLAGSCDTGQFAKTGKGYAVCETYLKYLNTLRDMPKCEAPVPPGFKHPDWEEMDVLKYLDMAYQAEAIYYAGWGGYKHPDFEVWRQLFLDEMQAGKIAPQMRRTQVQPFGEKTITLLAYTRDRAGCQNETFRQNSRWASNGYAHFLQLDDPAAPLRVIDNRVSKTQTELLLYAGKPYFVLRSFYATDIEIIAFDLKMTNTSGIAASIDAFYVNVAPGARVLVDTTKKFEPDPNVYWAGQLCHFSPVNP